MINTTDLAFSATMLYGVYPMVNGNLTAEELQRRLSDSQYYQYGALKVLSSAAARKLISKTGLKKFSLVGESVLCGALVAGSEYLLMNGNGAPLTDFTSTFLLHTISHTVVKYSAKKVMTEKTLV